MEVIFIKALSDDGHPSADSVQLERALRQKGFWRSISEVQDVRDIDKPRIIIESNGTTEEFTNAASFQQRFDLDTIERHEAQAACW